jgi:hypothetical protein
MTPRTGAAKTGRPLHGREMARRGVNERRRVGKTQEQTAEVHTAQKSQRVDRERCARLGRRRQSPILAKPMARFAEVHSYVQKQRYGSRATLL